jgi:serine/threonine-protein kinase RsbW
LQRLASDACEEACLDKIQLNRIALALDELFANIHAHGYANQGGEIDCIARWIELDPKHDECKLEILLRDFAPVIDGIKSCHGISPETLKDDPIAGGLGMYLIAATTEKFEHTPLADGNQWRLVFNVVMKKDEINESSN